MKLLIQFIFMFYIILHINSEEYNHDSYEHFEPEYEHDTSYHEYIPTYYKKKYYSPYYLYNDHKKGLYDILESSYYYPSIYSHHSYHIPNYLHSYEPTYHSYYRPSYKSGYSSQITNTYSHGKKKHYYSSYKYASPHYSEYYKK